ncbi:MAG: hypothetical protein PF444_01095 [Bacteroidales bacterium]|jgi:Ca2+/Na+ antiporter|nr:hypothetical protein [Bacteroidales bacterium]
MKKHLKAFIASAVLVVLGAILSKQITLELSLELIEQAKAISYMVTLAGIVVLFSWYKRTATPVDEGVTETPVENLAKQDRIFLFLVLINLVNAVMLMLSNEQSIQMMAGISLLIIVISPIVFRTMQEKDVMPPKDEETETETETKK